MSLTKDYLIALAERLYTGNPTGFFDFSQEREDLEIEEFEVTKGNYKTIITIKFNKEGYPVSHQYESILIPTEVEEQLNKLEVALQEAKDRNDYSGVLSAEENLRKFNGERINKKGNS